MVSVVILSYDPKPVILEQLAAQTHKDHEVIVAREPGIVRAMNIALKKAKGDIFVRIDDDVELPINWLEELVKPFKDPKVAGATGPTFVPASLRKNRDSIRIANNPNWFLRWMFDNDPFAPAKIYKCGSVSYGSNYLDKMTRGVTECDHLEGTNWAMRTQLSRDVGGFNESYDGVCEWYDTDVEQKILKKGYKLAFNEYAYLWHLLEVGASFDERFDTWSRIENWLRFHWRHSDFHYKKIIWFFMLIGYALCPKSR